MVKLLAILMILFSLTLSCSGENSKNHPDKTIELPEPRFKSGVSIEEVLKDRRSVRRYADKPLNLSEISQILWAAYGITEKIPHPDFLRGGFRTSPSAGALYPLEIYLAAGNITNLPSGVYKYNSEKHNLHKISGDDVRKYLADASQLMMERAPAVIIYSAVYERTTQKYGSRGRKRYVPMEAGHSAQNAALQAKALGIGVCTVGAFYDSKIKRIIGMPEREEPLYLLPMGKLPE